MLLLLSLLSSVVSLAPPYYRVYLQGLKRVDDERIRNEAIKSWLDYIEKNVVEMAKQGLMEYNSPPLQSCEAYVKENSTPDIDSCEYILNGILVKISEYYPDSLIVHNSSSGIYTLKWGGV
jgi:hypothetical protein